MAPQVLAPCFLGIEQSSEVCERAPQVALPGVDLNAAEAVPPVYLTISQVCETCQVTPRTVYKWIRSGRLPAYRLGPQAVRIAVDDLAAMLQPIGRSA